MREVIANMIQHRDLIVSFVRRDIKARYKQTALGVAWSLIQPLSMMIVFTLVFSISLWPRSSSSGCSSTTRWPSP